MEKLTTLEFIAASENFPQLVKIRRVSDGEILFELEVISWCRIRFGSDVMFQSKEDLVVEGVGLAKPYWNDDFVPQLSGTEQLQQITLIREMALRQLKAAEVSATPRQMIGSIV